jgi:elongation factor G
MAEVRPILSISVDPIDPLDRLHLHAVLDALVAADPSLRFSVNSATGATLISGSDLDHLGRIIHRIEHECLIPLDAAPPQVVCLETIQAAAAGEGKYIRQTGGSGNYGHVKLRLEPNTPGWGLQFASSIVGDVVPAVYLAPIEEGVREAARGGILRGHEITDVRVTLFDGSYHEIDSNPMAFRIAASLAFQDAARKARPIVLEPMMSTVLTLPESELSAQIAVISEMHGRIEETSFAGGIAVIRAIVPLRSLLRYDGPAAHIMLFSGYEPTRWPPDADSSGAPPRLPRSPRPRTGSAAADPDVDWT